MTRKKKPDQRSIRDQLREDHSDEWMGDYGVTVDLGLSAALEADPGDLDSLLTETIFEVSAALEWLERIKRTLDPALAEAYDAEDELRETVTDPTEEQLVAARTTAFVAALDKSNALVGAE